MSHKHFEDESAHIFKHAREKLHGTKHREHDGKRTVEISDPHIPPAPELAYLLQKVATPDSPKPKTVLDFGAKGSPSDDTEAFKKAIIASKKSKVRVVVPEGEFTVREEMEFTQLHFIGTVRFA